MFASSGRRFLKWIISIICFMIGWIIGDRVYNIFKWNKINKLIEEQNEFKKDVEEFVELVTENLETKTKLINSLYKNIKS